MKTIFRTNRPQNKYIGFSLLLLIAVFGLFIGGVKPPTGDVTAPSIGGNGTVAVPGPTPIAATIPAEIGGQHVPRDTSPMPYSSHTELVVNVYQVMLIRSDWRTMLQSVDKVFPVPRPELYLAVKLPTLAVTAVPYRHPHCP